MTAQSRPFLFFVPVLLLAAAVPAGCVRDKSSAPLMHEKKSAELAEAEEQVASTAAAAPLRYRNEADRQAGHAEVIPFGPAFKPTASAERRLEYTINLSYQITDLRSTRAFFNQWIPRYGFLISESAS